MTHHTASPIYDQVEVVDTKACVTCDTLIEADLDQCPHCQSTQPGPTPRFRASSLGLFAIVALAALGFVMTNETPVVDTATLNDPEPVETLPPEPQPVVELLPEDHTALSNIVLDAQTLRKCDAYFDTLGMCEVSLSSFEDNLEALQELSEVDFAAYCVTVRDALLPLVGTSDPRISRAFNRAYIGWRSCRENE